MIKLSVFIVVLGLLATLSANTLSAQNNSPVHTGKKPKTTPRPHLKTLAKLRANDNVIPPKSLLHPVSAMYNREAIIPPQCYTRTEGQFNPCYVCHQNERKNRENVMNDGLLQVAYSFSEQGMTNHWRNLFNDKRQAIENISDAEILSWVHHDNYSALATRLSRSAYSGWIPDLKNLHLGADAFDPQGFAKDGSHWVAFNYKPLPSTFWPTNGSTDDVMIRLPSLYRSAEDGQFSQDTYRANLAILEANIKGLDKISSPPIDERAFHQDLNQDGKLGIITDINQVDAYVGAAKKHFLDRHLYPEGTEFLHTVRYLGIRNDGTVGISTRMKEVRYMKKWKAYTKPVYARQYALERFEKEAGNLPGYTDLGDYGLDNGSGWSISGFIESHDGKLRANTHEENFFCMGCHTSIGSTIDKTFSFARKIDGAAGWGYINLKGMIDAPNRGETQGEVLTYFERVGGGDEFRSNTEMLNKWFNRDGSVNRKKVLAAKDMYELITPSRQRALALNKAYKTIVTEQNFIFGRNATITAPQNVYQKIDNTSAPTLPEALLYEWDIRLDWSSSLK